MQHGKIKLSHSESQLVLLSSNCCNKAKLYFDDAVFALYNWFILSC